MISICHFMPVLFCRPGFPKIRWINIHKNIWIVKPLYNLQSRPVIYLNAPEAFRNFQYLFWKIVPIPEGIHTLPVGAVQLPEDGVAGFVKLVVFQVGLEDGPLGLDAADSGPGPQEAAEGAELRRAVAAGLARLSDDHRQGLVLRELQELSYEEIARMLDIDLGTVKSRIARARLNLRKILLEDGNFFEHRPSKPLNDKNERG